MILMHIMVLGQMSMEAILQKLIEQSPAMGFGILLVWLFLRHIKSEREQQNIFFERLHEQNIEARNMSREAMKENAQATAHNALMTQRNTDTLLQLQRTIEVYGMPNKIA